ncbi:hypothetical protein [Mucilaginibacter sp. CSA2-8R]|uniref:hypothetical protein n=1 Tax=Mucilaginibacter sp. CSA2-8R TaxID=3141542 RepID=UPI00315D0B21
MKSLAQAERLLGRRLSKPELVLFICYRRNTDYTLGKSGGNLMMQPRVAGFPQLMARLLYQPYQLLQTYAARQNSL